MAGSINKVILVGNVGQDPQIRTMNNGQKVASFSLTFVLISRIDFLIVSGLVFLAVSTISWVLFFMVSATFFKWYLGFSSMNDGSIAKNTLIDFPPSATLATNPL